MTELEKLRKLIYGEDEVAVAEIEAPTEEVSQANTGFETLKNLIYNGGAMERGSQLAQEEAAALDNISNRDTLIGYYDTYSSKLQNAINNNNEEEYYRYKTLVDKVEERMRRTADLGTFLKEGISRVPATVNSAIADVQNYGAGVGIALSNEINANDLYNIAMTKEGIWKNKQQEDSYNKLFSLFQQHRDDENIVRLHDIVSSGNFKGDKGLIEYLVDYANNINNAERYKSFESQNTAYKQQWRSDLAEKQALSNYSPAQNVALNATDTVSYMIPSMVTGGIASGAGLSAAAASNLGIGAMSLGKAGSQLSDALKKGNNFDNSLEFATASGALSYLTEKIGGDFVNSAIAGAAVTTPVGRVVQDFINKSGIQNRAAKSAIMWAAGINAEGFEEVIEDIGDAVLKSAVLNDYSDWKDVGSQLTSSYLESILPTIILSGFGQVQVINSVNKIETEIKKNITENKAIDDTKKAELIKGVEEAASNARLGLTEDYQNKMVELERELGKANKDNIAIQMTEQALKSFGLEEEKVQEVMTKVAKQEGKTYNPTVKTTQQILDEANKVPVSYKSIEQINKELETVKAQDKTITTLEPVTEISKALQNIKKAVENLTGKQVVYVDAGTTDNSKIHGLTNKYTSNNLYVAVGQNVRDSIAATFHELGHHLSLEFPDLYKAYEDRYKQAHPKATDYEIEEMFGDKVGSVMSKQENVKEYDNKSQSFISNFKDYFSNKYLGTERNNERLIEYNLSDKAYTEAKENITDANFDKMVTNIVLKKNDKKSTKNEDVPTKTNEKSVKKDTENAKKNGETQETEQNKQAEKQKLKDKLKELVARVQEKYGNVVELSKEEAEQYVKLKKEMSDTIYTLEKNYYQDISEKNIKDERLTSLDKNIYVQARKDILQNKDIYDAIEEASFGVFFDSNTPVDDIMEGKNKKVTAKELYDAFSKTRELLRNQYGDTIILYRVEGLQKSKATKNYGSSLAYTEQYGTNVKSYNIKVKDIIAINTNRSGTYEDIIVANGGIDKYLNKELDNTQNKLDSKNQESPKRLEAKKPGQKASVKDKVINDIVNYLQNKKLTKDNFEDGLDMALEKLSNSQFNTLQEQYGVNKTDVDELYNVISKDVEDKLGSEIKFSATKNLSNTIGEDIDKILSGPPLSREKLLLRKRIPKLLEIYGIKNKPMKMVKRHIVESILSKDEAIKLGFKPKSGEHFHEMGKKLFIKAINQIDTPSAILRWADNPKNKYGPDDYVLLTNLTNVEKGKYGRVIVPLLLEDKGDYYEVKSVYGKEQVFKYLSDNNDFLNLLYKKDKRASNLGGIYFPARATNSLNDNESISSPKDNVKIDFSRTTEDGSFSLRGDVQDALDYMDDVMQIKPEKKNAYAETIDNMWIRLGRNIIRNVFNENEALVKFDNTYAKKMKKKIDNVPSVLRVFDNFRRANNPDIILRQISTGIRDFTTDEKMSKGLAEIIEDLSPTAAEARAEGMSVDDLRAKRVSEFMKLGLAERAIEMNERGLESGIEIEKAQKIVDAFKNNKKLHQALDDFRNIGNTIIDQGVKQGVWTEEMANTIKENNLMYFPMNRVFEDGDTYYGGKKGKDGSVNNGIFKLKGSTRTIENPLISAVGNWARMLQVIETNYMYQQLAKAGAELGEANTFFKEVKPLKKFQGQVTLEVFRSRLNKQLKELGYNELVNGLNYDELYKIFVPENGSVQDRTLSFLVDGKRKYIQFYDNDYGKPMYEVLSSVGATRGAEFAELIKKLSQGITYGATIANPEFALSNMASDSFTRYLFGDGFTIPLLSTVFDAAKLLSIKTGSTKIANKLGVDISKSELGQIYDKFLRSGASQGTKFRNNFENIYKNHLEDIFGYNEKKMFGKSKETVAKELAEKIGKIATAFPEFSEEVGRFGLFAQAYKMYKAQGLSEGEAIRSAGMKAREGTQDFTIKGKYMKELNKFIPYSAATIGGIYNYGRQFKKHPVRLTARTAALMSMTMLILSMMDDDDRKYYEEMNKTKKFANYVIPNGTSEPVIIKKPQGPARVLINLVEMTYNIANGYIPEDKIEDEVKDWAVLSLADQVPIANATDAIPAVIQPFVENALNKDLYYNSQLIADNLLKLDPKNQYNEYTSELSKALGGLLNYSPIKLDNIIKGEFAGIGKGILNLTDNIVRSTTGNVLPDAKKSETYFYDKFFANSLRSPESVNEVYERYNELETEKAEGRMTAQQQVEYGKLTTAKSIMSDLNKQIKETRNDSKLTGEQKARKIEQLQEQKTDTARYYLGKNLINTKNKTKIELMEYYPSNDTYTYTVNKDKKVELDFSSESVKNEYAKKFKENYDKMLENLKKTTEYKNANATQKVELEKEQKTKARTQTTNDMKKIVYERTK